MKDILPLESKMAESANYLAGHGQAGFEKEQMSSVHGWLWAGCCGLRAVQAWKILDRAISSCDVKSSSEQLQLNRSYPQW